MLTVQAQQQLLLRNGVSYPKGTEFTAQYRSGQVVLRLFDQLQGHKPFCCPISSAHKFFDVFEPAPDFEELMSSVYCSVFDTPTGTSVEPDGKDEWGFPSWLIIYGLI